MTNPAELPVSTPSPEEMHLVYLASGQFSIAAEEIVDGLQAGEPARILSVARPDILRGTGEALYPKLLHTAEPAIDSYRTRLFQTYLKQAAEGNPAATSSLPKFASTTGELALALEVIFDNWDSLEAWRSNRAYIQMIGSYNPQHIGHRDTIARTLDAAGDHASTTIQVVANHPIKADSLPPYETRFRPGEERLYSSDLIDPTRTTLLDVPLGLGLAKVGYAQIELLADVMGDPKMRWLVGSDKFITDVRNVQAGKMLDKAGARFEGVHLYVARRVTESVIEMDRAIDYLDEQYGTEVTVIPEPTNPIVLAASASKIRDLRSIGEHEAADVLEFSDLHTIATSTR